MFIHLFKGKIMSLPYKDELEKRINHTQLKFNEISINIESLDRELDHLMSELGFEPKKLQEFVQNPNNFSASNWEKLKEEQKKLNDKLHLSLKNVHDPMQVKKMFSERATIQPHWIFVR